MSPYLPEAMQSFNMRAVNSTDCHCGLPAPYSQCCERWHRGLTRLLAPDAERLMRSRYSAYVLGDLNGRATRLHEISQFERVEGKWVYVEGVDGSREQREI